MICNKCQCDMVLKENVEGVGDIFSCTNPNCPSVDKELMREEKEK